MQIPSLELLPETRELGAPCPEDYPIRLLILQTSPFCNIDCGYCYLSPEQRASTAKMPLEVVVDACRFLRESGLLGKKLTVLWHAGEPTAQSPRHYEDHIATLTEALGDRVSLNFNIQTNAVALKDEWIDLIKRHDIAVGVSIDGPRDIHDRYRRTRSGKGTFDLTMRGIEKLRSAGVDFSTLSVVSDASLGRASEIISFLHELRPVSIGFNLEEVEGHNRQSSAGNRREIVRQFFETIYAWLDERGDLTLSREFKAILLTLSTYDRQPKQPRQGDNKRHSILTVAHDGRVSTFSPELANFPVPGTDSFMFGRVVEPFEQYRGSQPLHDVSAKIELGVEMCRRDCNYFDFCGGGSPSNKFQELGRFDATETDHCRSYKQVLVDVALDRLKNLVIDGP